MFCKKILSISIALTLLLLSGCSGKDDTMSAAETKKIVSVSDLKSDMDAALSKEYKQFILSDNCHSSVPDKLYDCTFTTKKDFSDKHLEVFENTLGISPIDEKYLREDDDYMGDGYVYDNLETKEYAAISDSGFVSFFSDEMYKVDFGSFPIKALYVNGDENWCGEKSEFDLNGADFSVEKAVDICDKWIAEKWQKYEPDFDFVPSHIFKLQNGDSQIMSVKMNKYYEGVKLSGCDMLNLEYETPVYTQVRNSEMTIYINKQGKVIAMTTGGSSLSAGEKKEIDECISLSYALELAEDTFSEYNKLNVVAANLKYKVNYQVDSTCESFTAEDVFNSAVPVWEILIRPDYPDFENFNMTDCSSLLYINVNALSGEIDFALNPSERQMGV